MKKLWCLYSRCMSGGVLPERLDVRAVSHRGVVRACSRATRGNAPVVIRTSRRFSCGARALCVCLLPDAHPLAALPRPEQQRPRSLRDRLQACGACSNDHTHLAIRRPTHPRGPLPWRVVTAPCGELSSLPVGDHPAAEQMCGQARTLSLTAAWVVASRSLHAGATKRPRQRPQQTEGSSHGRSATRSTSLTTTAPATARPTAAGGLTTIR